MLLEALPQISADPRSHKLARLLREMIITGGLTPGDRIVERDISARTGISRGPVREALKQLEQEGLVTSLPYRGTEVADVSQEEVEEILVPLRLVLERFAFRHALMKMSEGDFKELDRVVVAMRKAVNEENLSGVVDTDVRFHELVFARANQPHCTQVWQTIVPRVRAYFYRDTPRHASLSHLPDEHAELLEAMRSRNMSIVQPVLDKHILETIYLDRAGNARGRAEASLNVVDSIEKRDDAR